MRNGLSNRPVPRRIAHPLDEEEEDDDERSYYTLLYRSMHVTDRTAGGENDAR